MMQYFHLFILSWQDPPRLQLCLTSVWHHATGRVVLLHGQGDATVTVHLTHNPTSQLFTPQTHLSICYGSCRGDIDNIPFMGEKGQDVDMQPSLVLI
jgi:hypothetical protein